MLYLGSLLADWLAYKYCIVLLLLMLSNQAVEMLRTANDTWECLPKNAKLHLLKWQSPVY